MWITAHSAAVVPVLIEIEDPRKQWFTDKGVERSELTQARNQIRQWQTWFDEPLNEQQFRARYIDNLDHRAFEPHYILVYGRRADATANKLANKGRVQAEGAFTRTMTFDRLRPNIHLSNSVTLRQTTGGFEVKTIPPTFSLGPWPAMNLNGVTGVADAVEANGLISDARREFLLERLPYWVSWAQAQRAEGLTGLVGSSGLE